MNEYTVIPFDYFTSYLEYNNIGFEDLNLAIQGVNDELRSLNTRIEVIDETLNTELENVTLGIWGTNVNLDEIKGLLQQAINNQTTSENHLSSIESAIESAGEYLRSIQESSKSASESITAISEGLETIAEDYGEILATIGTNVEMFNTNLEATNSSIAAVGIQLNVMIIMLFAIIAYGVGRFLWRVIYGWFLA